VARETLKIPGRWNRGKVLAGLDLDKMAFDPRMRILPATAGQYEAPVTTMLPRRAFAFVGVPTEIFVDDQIDIRVRVTGVPVLSAGSGRINWVRTWRSAPATASSIRR